MTKETEQKQSSPNRRGLIIIGIAMLWIVGGFLFYEYRATERQTPPSADCTLAELAEKVVAPKHLAMMTRDDSFGLVWIGPVPAYTLRSGPPCYIFDQNGRLKGWTSETGEGSSLDKLAVEAMKAPAVSLEDALKCLEDGGTLADLQQ